MSFTTQSLTLKIQEIVEQKLYMMIKLNSNLYHTYNFVYLNALFTYISSQELLITFE